MIITHNHVISGSLNLTVSLKLDFAPGAFPGVTPAQLSTALEGLMSQLSDAIAAASNVAATADASLDAMIKRAQGDLTGLNTKVADLDTQIAALQAQINAGGASQADLDALAGLQATVAGIQTKADQFDPTTATVLPPTP